MSQFADNSVCTLFGIEYPVISGGMVWASGAKLAAAVSNAGGLGLIGAGSMKPDLLDAQIKKCTVLTDKPFGVNIPLAGKYSESHIEICIKNGVKIVFTAAGSPKKYTAKLKEHGIIVAHVVPSAMLARKVEDAGCDAVVAEGTEAGGHNGREGLTSFVLWPSVADTVNIPFIAAGGVCDGRSMAAAFVLGAKGVQIGTRFAATRESTAHQNYKDAVVAADTGSARIYNIAHMPIRSLSNEYVEEFIKMERSGASIEKLMEFRGKMRTKTGVFEGDNKEGELVAGQVSGLIKDIPSVDDFISLLIADFITILKF